MRINPSWTASLADTQEFKHFSEKSATLSRRMMISPSGVFSGHPQWKRWFYLWPIPSKPFVDLFFHSSKARAALLITSIVATSMVIGDGVISERIHIDFSRFEICFLTLTLFPSLFSPSCLCCERHLWSGHEDCNQSIGHHWHQHPDSIHPLLDPEPWRPPHLTALHANHYRMANFDHWHWDLQPDHVRLLHLQRPLSPLHLHIFQKRWFFRLACSPRCDARADRGGRCVVVRG